MMATLMQSMLQRGNKGMEIIYIGICTASGQSCGSGSTLMAGSGSDYRERKNQINWIRPYVNNISFLLNLFVVFLFDIYSF